MPSIPLSRPIEHDGQKIASLEVDEPTIGAIEAFENAKAAGKGDLTATIEMLAFDWDLPAEVVRRIRSGDMQKINEALGPFVEDASLGGLGAASSQSARTS